MYKIVCYVAIRMVNAPFLSLMPLQSRYETTHFISPHCLHPKTTKTSFQCPSPPFQSQTIVQNHQPLPSLLQKPLRIRHPLPPISTTDSTPISKIRKNLSFSTASDVLRLMDSLQLPIEADTYASLLRECACFGDLLQGSAVHAHIRRKFTADRSVGLGLANRLLFMYASCGQPKLAHKLFDQMPVMDSISRIITITALSEKKDHLDALRVFVQMHSGREDWWLVDPLGFKVVLWACVRAGELGLGQQLHGLALKLTGCSSFADHLAPLIKFYAMLDYPDSSLQLMLASPSDDREEAVWLSIVSAYSRIGCFRKPLMIFREIERRSVGKRKMMRSKMLAIIIAACAGSKGGKEGYEVHAVAVKIGVDGDPYVGCSLVKLYSKRGLLVEARRAFDAVGGGGRDPACWNAMLGGYARGGGVAEKLLFLEEMKAAGMEPHEAILNQVL